QLGSRRGRLGIEQYGRRPGERPGQVVHLLGAGGAATVLEHGQKRSGPLDPLTELAEGETGCLAMMPEPPAKGETVDSHAADVNIADSSALDGLAICLNA